MALDRKKRWKNEASGCLKHRLLFYSIGKNKQLVKIQEIRGRTRVLYFDKRTNATLQKYSVRSKSPALKIILSKSIQVYSAQCS